MWVAGWPQVVSIVEDLAGRPYSQRPYKLKGLGLHFVILKSKFSWKIILSLENI